MSDGASPPVGTIGWCDLTVDDAEGVRDFYRTVVGWSSTPVSMGDYDDYNMTPPDAETPVAGICHARGANADLPARWLLYVLVDDLESSLARCRDEGGEVVTGPRSAGGGRYAVIRDPAGAVLGLFAEG